MTGGIGFVRDTQNSSKLNRNNLKNKTNFSQTYKTKTPHKELAFKEATPEEVEEFKARFVHSKAEEKKNEGCHFAFQHFNNNSNACLGIF